MVPKSVINEADKKGDEGQKSKRTKGFKHFNQVGYMGLNMKEVPRWAIDGEAHNKVILYQRDEQQAKGKDIEVFGKLNPKIVQKAF